MESLDEGFDKAIDSLSFPQKDRVGLQATNFRSEPFGSSPMKNSLSV
ncbi:MAG: hypothetical protein ACYCT9_07860 [Leptospirillum sp.]